MYLKNQDNNPFKLCRTTAAALALGGTLILAGCGDNEPDDDLTVAEVEEAAPAQRGQPYGETPGSNLDAEANREPGMARNGDESMNREGTASGEMARSLEKEKSEQDTRSDAVRSLAPEDAQIRDSAEIALREETLNVETERVPAGGILLRKKVVTDDASETVQLRREQIEVVRLSPEEARQRQEDGTPSEFSQNFSEEEVFIPVMQEEARANKEVQTREVVRAQKQADQFERDVEATLRREELQTQRVEGERQDATDRDTQLAGNQDETSREMNREQSDQTQQGAVARSSDQAQDATSEQTGMAASQSDDSADEELRSNIEDRLRRGVGLSDAEIAQLKIEVDDNEVTVSGPAPNGFTSSDIKTALGEIEGIEVVHTDF